MSVEAPGHVLTDRDMAIVAAVADYKLLSRSQIQRLFGFTNTTRVNFRLIRLYQHGYLTRHYLPTVKGSSQAIYTLDRAGLPAAAKRHPNRVRTHRTNARRPSAHVLVG